LHNEQGYPIIGVRWSTIISLVIQVVKPLSKYDLARYRLGDKAR